MNLLASMRYLVALDEHRHFGRAAQACHITQPALSNALRALEAEYGVVIVRRGRAYVGLTDEGRRVLESAQRMLHESELLKQELRSSADAPAGSLRMGAVPTAVPLLARFAAQLQVLHPGIVPSVLSLSSQSLEEGLVSLSLDLALGYTDRMDMQDVKLTAWSQTLEHYFLLRRADAPSGAGLQIGAPITWAQAARQPLCLLTPDMHNRTIIDQALAAAGATVKPTIETNSVMALVHCVATGNVGAVLPGAMVAASRSHGGLEALPLVSPAIGTPIGFMAQEGVRPSRAMEAAVALLQSPAWREQVEANSGALSA